MLYMPGIHVAQLTHSLVNGDYQVSITENVCDDTPDYVIKPAGYLARDTRDI